MKKVKLLWSICFSLLYIVALSFISALLVDTNSAFYKGLNMPSFMPSPAVFSTIWFFVYLIFVITLTEMISKNPQKSIIFSYILLALSNILYLTCFFRFYSLIFGLVFVIISLLIVFYITIKFYKSGFKTTFLFIPVILWYIFAIMLSYSLLINN